MKNFFKGLSFSQLFASALAAVTSFLLASKIGIAGSVIGAAVASFVSTGASQVYKNVIDESNKKLRDATQSQSQSTHDDATSVIDNQGEHSDEASHTAVIDSLEDTSDHTQVMRSQQPRVVQSVAHNKRTASHLPQDSAKQLKKDKRNVVIIAVVSALIAVGITAAIILAVTDGKGTGNIHPQPQETTSITQQPEHSQEPQQSVPEPTPDTNSNQLPNNTNSNDSNSDVDTKQDNSTSQQPDNTDSSVQKPSQDNDSSTTAPNTGTEGNDQQQNTDENAQPGTSNQDSTNQQKKSTGSSSQQTNTPVTVTQPQ